jgi:N-hydroxyarylamine O-acetyltransferase
MDIDSYLVRIRAVRPASPDLQALCTLQLAHLQTVPFENLDIHAGVPIILDDASLFAKIVGRRRGGICYELNGAFAWLLRALGFDVTIVAANVHDGAGDWTPDFDHMALVVSIDDERYLVDVGFGDSCRVPLALTQCGRQDDGVQDYAMASDGGWYTLSKAQAADPALSLQPSFRFNLTPRSFEEFVPRCHFHQTSQESHFRRKTICSRASAAGRITFTGTELVFTKGTARSVTPLADVAAADNALADSFGIAV